MKTSIKTLLASAAVVAIAYAAPVTAETTVIKKEIITTTPVPAPVVKTTTVTTETSGEVQTSETHWKTSETAIVPAGAHVFKIVDFDLNNDHILSRYEVGQRLFKFYDTDGNEVIDNMEYGRKAVLTVVPVEKETVIVYDLDGDGISDQTQVTYETFLRDTLLTRFDGNKDGLSPHEFTGREFIVADINNDKVVDLTEWKSSYDAQLDAQTKAKANVNH